MLFGSFHRLNYTPESDVDILIVVDRSDDNFLERKDRYAVCFDEIPFDVNLLIYTQDEIKKMLANGNLFIKDVLTSSREL